MALKNMIHSKNDAPAIFVNIDPRINVSGAVHSFQTMAQGFYKLGEHYNSALISFTDY